MYCIIHVVWVGGSYNIIFKREYKKNKFIAPLRILNNVFYPTRRAWDLQTHALSLLLFIIIIIVYTYLRVIIIPVWRVLSRIRCRRPAEHALRWWAARGGRRCGWGCDVTVDVLSFTLVAARFSQNCFRFPMPLAQCHCRAQTSRLLRYARAI